MGDALTDFVLAYDVGPQVGLGHRRRMEALGRALAQRGIQCSVTPLEGRVRAEAVVVDSYLRRADDPSHVQGEAVIALDDLERDLRVDLVIDPTPGASPGRNAAGAEVLAGAGYALIGPGLPHRARPLGPTVERILVTAGGGERGGVLGSSLGSELARRCPGVEVCVAVGPWSKEGEPAGTTPIRTEDGLGDAIDAADLVVTAAGVTLLEALALGRPTVAMVTADNQRRAAAGIARAGAALVVAPEEVVAATTELIDDTQRRAGLSAAALTLIDRQGPSRVAAAICDLLASDGRP